MHFLCALLLFKAAASTHSKFIFDSQTQPQAHAFMSRPACTLSGVRTVHLPPSSTPQSLRLRLLFAAPAAPASRRHSTAASLDFFDAESRRLGRIELAFLLGHVQVSFGGVQSPWLPLLRSGNFIEVGDTGSIGSDIALNGRRIAPSSFVPEFQAPAFEIAYHDDPAPPGDDWSDLLESLRLDIEWQPPVRSAERLIANKLPPRRAGAIDSIAYDESLSVQLASGQPLPRAKIPKSAASRQESSANGHSVLAWPGRLQHQNHQLPPWTLLAVAFACYLGVLLKMAQMTSVRKPPSSTAPSAPVPASPLNHVAKPKSPPSALTLTLTANSVLKVSVPAALSLADNRHIVFPSKLRNFQK